VADNFNTNPIIVDLNSPITARVIRDAARSLGSGVTTADVGRIKAIRINGTAGAGDGTIVLRCDGASGREIFKLIVPSGSEHDGTVTELDVNFRGIYMDAIATAWVSGARMYIYLE
jgi:hypothetical protein